MAMKTTFGVVGLVLWACLGIAAAQQPTPPSPSAPAPAPQVPPQPKFEARAEVVLVDVTVVSGNGDPVTGLTAADFALEVNGQPRSVHTVQFISSLGMKTAAEAPRLAGVSSNDGPSTGRLLLFVVDENYLRFGSARAVLRTAERVMASLPAGDMVGLARVPTGRGGVEFTTDRERIRRALSGTMGAQPSRSTDRVRLSEAHSFEVNDQSTWQQVVDRECGVQSPGTGGAGGGMGRELCINELEAQAKYVVGEANVRTRVSIGAFEQLARQLALMKAPVNIVLLSEGLYIGRSTGDLNTLAQLAAQARISFFVVQPDESIFDMDSPRTVGGLPQEFALAQGLQQLAGLTRGEYFSVSTSGAGVFDRIGRELTGYYLLSFEPTEADKTSRDRRIKVEVKRRGLTVRARSTYAVTDATTNLAALTPLEQVKSLLAAPLPTAGLKMRVATYSVANPQDERVRVIISAEIGDAAAEPADWPVGILVADDRGKVLVSNATSMKLAPASDRTETSRLFLTSVVLEPGEYMLRLAAADGSGAAGSVYHTITARLPELDGNSLRVSDLILSPMVDAGEAPRPIPSSILYSETVAAILELAGSDPKRLADSKVSVQIAESDNGPALVTFPAQSIPRVTGQRSFVASLKLGVLPPGEYVARAVVAIPGHADAHVTRSFRLAPVATVADASPIALRVASDDAPAPLPIARIAAPVTRFAVDDVLAPEVVRGFLDDLQLSHPVSSASAPIVQQARNGTYLSPPPDNRTPDRDEPTLAFIRGLAQLQKKQYAQATAWFQLSLKGASDFLGAAFYLGAVHAANGRDHDAVGAWQMSLLNGSKTVYPMLVDATLRIGDGQGALELIAEAPEAWPSDEARLRRVATAQAMLGQFEPALAALHPLLARRADDTDLLFVALQVMYRQHLTRALSAEDRTRFDDYSKRYAAAGGSEAALVETWRRYVRR